MDSPEGMRDDGSSGNPDSRYNPPSLETLEERKYVASLMAEKHAFEKGLARAQDEATRAHRRAEDASVALSDLSTASATLQRNLDVEKTKYDIKKKELSQALDRIEKVEGELKAERDKHATALQQERDKHATESKQERDQHAKELKDAVREAREDERNRPLLEYQASQGLARQKDKNCVIM